MAPFPAQVKAVPRAGVKVGPHGYQFMDALRSLVHHHFHDVRMAEALPHGEGVLNMILKLVVRPQHRGNAPLSLARGGLHDVPFGDNIDRSEFSHFQGITQTCQPRS